jgi:hypothetical protein
MRVVKNNEQLIGDVRRASLGPLARAIIVSVGLLFILTACHVAPSGLSAKARSDFEWFNTLGFPDVKGSPCVRLENGGSWTAKGEPRWIDHILAFVLATNAATLKVFTADLSDRSVTNPSSPKERMRSGAFEWADLREQAKAQIRELQTRSPEEDAPFRHFHRTSEERTEVFFLAWACWRQGMLHEAQQLYNEAQKLPARIHRHEYNLTFRRALEQDIGHNMMWRAIRELGDPSVSRTEVMRQLETILKNYPHSRHCERARQTAQVLRRMIAEDQAHMALSASNFARLQIEEQARELIYQLRDQNGHQVMTPGRCDIFLSWSSPTNTAAHQLVRLGYPAVPQLIAVLDSETLTRSLGPIRFTDDPDFVLTVGDCAEAILQRITGKSFFVGRSGGDYLSNTYMSAARKGSSVRKTAEAWWSNFQKKGEKQALVDAVATGGHDAPAQAELLAHRYPDVATAALVEGAKAATNGFVRASLVHQIGKMGDPSGLDFLRDELVHSPLLESRIAAAFVLRTLDHETAIAAMIKEWLRKPEQTEENEYVWNQVPAFLSGCDSDEAIEALTADIRQRSPRAKYEVVVALGDTNRWSWRHEAEPASPKTVEATERALVLLLEDKTECFNISFSRNDKGLSDPRVCDLAAWFLSDRWPDRYSFDVRGSLESRNRQRLLSLNTWRTAHNLPAEPLPTPKSITNRPKVARVNSTVVTSVEWSEDSAEPRAVFAARISALKNHRLDAKGFVKVLTTFAAHPEPNAMGLELKAFKDGDLTGIRLVARLIPGTPPSPDGSIGWDVSRHVELGSKSIQGNTGGGRLDAYSAPGDWEDLAAGIKKALSSPPETTFEIGAKIVGAGGTRITKPNK